eukprot:6487819-Amphidinium_carterae.2
MGESIGDCTPEACIGLGTVEHLQLRGTQFVLKSLLASCFMLQANLMTYDFWAVGINCCSGNEVPLHSPNLQILCACTSYTTERTGSSFRAVRLGSYDPCRMSTRARAGIDCTCINYCDLMADFRCGDYNNPGVFAGLRLMQ